MPATDRKVFHLALIFITFVILLNVTLTPVKSACSANKSQAEFWPIAPIGKAKQHPSKETLYKPSKKVWPDLPYTDTEIKLKALKGFLWMTRFMNDENNLKGNENNYLTMLSTTFCSARDPYLRRMALEEAKRVSLKLTTDGFISRYEKDNDFDSLIEYLTLFNHLEITVPELKEKSIRMLEKEKQNIINRVNREKQESLDSDQLYDTMLMTYYMTGLKKQYPDSAVLRNMPDLSDFLVILGRYKYHMEDVENPDLAALTQDDIADITDDLYNITHVFFVFSDYNAYKIPRKYFQRETKYMLKFSDLICSKYHNDPDLLTEVVYVLTMMGYPANNGLIKQGRIKMLDSQREDGSWEAFGIDKDASGTDKNYDIFHATWVAYDMIFEPSVTGTLPFYKPLIKPLENYGNTHRIQINHRHKK